jgi:hypothetical protein
VLQRGNNRIHLKATKLKMSNNYMGDRGKNAVKQSRDSGHKQKRRWERKRRVAPP